MRGLSMRRSPASLLIALLLGACGGEPSPPAEVSAQQGAPVETKAQDVGVDAPSAPEAGIVAGPPPPAVERHKAELPDWEPELPEPAALDIEQQLALAQKAFDEGRVERGADNALGIYLALLETDPAQPDALAGIERVIQHLAQRADAALAERRLDDAMQDVAVLRRIAPDEAGTTNLLERVDRAQEIVALLAEARRFGDEERILEPEGQNAVARYGEVLARDPGNAEALAGLRRLEAALVAQATAAAEAGDYTSSDRLLADAARIQADSGSVQDASTQIVELRQGRAGELLALANQALARRDLARAQQLLGQLEQVSAQAQGLEELRTRIVQARLYGGHAPGQSLRDTLARGGSGPELVVIPVGRFSMGSPNGEPGRKKNEGPRHEIEIARGFALARSETTVAEFARFVEATGYVGSAENRGASTIYDERTGSMAERRNVDWRRNHAGARAESDLPVVHVSWEDAKAYSDWLSRETGASYRLPSEAEFEYALRAGGSTRYAWGDEAPTRPVANLTGQKDRSETSREWSNGFAGYGDGFWGTAPVRAYRANPFGVHDIDGNVSEWVEDCWHETYARAPADGTAWVNPGCKARVIRGASWASAPDQARSAFRLKATSATTNARVGFRVIRDL